MSESSGSFPIPDKAREAIQAAREEEDRRLADARRAGEEAAAKRRGIVLPTVMAVTPPPDSNPDAPAGIEDRADELRLNGQQRVVWKVMADGAWRTARELEALTGFEWASISARLRDLRKPKYGGHTVERQARGNGLYAYRLIISEEDESDQEE